LVPALTLSKEQTQKKAEKETKQTKKLMGGRNKEIVQPLSLGIKTRAQKAKKKREGAELTLE